MPRKKSKDEFIKEVYDLYGDTIDLSSFDFINYQTKGLCKCTVCGYEWYARPYSLVAGHGCRKCYDKRNSEQRTQNLEEIQERVHQIQPNVDIIGDYVNTRHNVLCKCSACGNEWSTLPSHILRGHGCPVCNGGTKITHDIFIQKCKDKYGDKYDLGQVQFRSLLEDITIVCKKHGPFTIQAKRFLRRATEVCPYCREEMRKKKQKKNQPIKEKIVKALPKRMAKSELHQCHSAKFMQKIQEIFKDKDYDFSKAVYINHKTKVDIICRKHGPFSAVPYSLLSGHGCPVCGNNGFYYKTSADWIRRAQEKHPEFDYSETVYVNNKNPLNVICPIHGKISVWPKLFMKQEQPCSQCRMEKSNKERSNVLWRRVEEVYSDRDYSILTPKDAIITTSSHIEVKCNEHDCTFQPSVGNILTVKCGCPQCGIERNANRRRLTLDEVLNRIKEIHGDRYDLSQIKEGPKNIETKIPLICNRHGVFYTTVHGISAGHGCPKCGREENGLSLRLTQEEFLERVNKIHLGKDYDWSKAVYVTNTTPVTVICNKKDMYGHIHGPFQSIPSRLMIGQGCPKCNSSKLEQMMRRVLILDGIEYEEQKRFPEWLGLLSYDFYIPSKRIAIECQGSQHFTDKSVGYFKSDLDEIKERDRRKAQLSKENGIQLIYFMEERWVQYITDDGIYFTDIDKLLDYLHSLPSKQ